MSPAKKKGKHRHPPPRYRKKAKGGTSPATDSPAAVSALASESTAPKAVPRASERSGPSAVVSLDPLAPIIVRSGRPMQHADADPAQFPPPSTIAGCLRTAWARATGRPFGPELAQLSVAGPLLLDDSGRILASRPADALYFGHDDASHRVVRAAPHGFDSGCGADLPAGLLPVQLTAQADGKSADGPAWWSWDDLLAFRRGEPVPFDRLLRNGWSPPSGDLRTHVSIDPTTGAVLAGALFQTEGLDLDASPAAFRRSAAGLTGTGAPGAGGVSTGGFRLLVRCGEALDATLVHLGGKRRLAALEPEPENRWPAPPDGWLERIRQAGRLCLTLLTPAPFSAGYRPGWLDDTLTGSPPDVRLTLRLRAAAVGRWEPHSGWALALRRPRATRKLVTAGATYWFDVLGACDIDSLAALWLASVCDDEQDRRDGFGLALPGPWTPPAGDGADS